MRDGMEGQVEGWEEGWEEGREEAWSRRRQGGCHRDSLGKGERQPEKPAEVAEGAGRGQRRPCVAARRSATAVTAFIDGRWTWRSADGAAKPRWPLKPPRVPAAAVVARREKSSSDCLARGGARGVALVCCGWRRERLKQLGCARGERVRGAEQHNAVGLEPQQDAAERAASRGFVGRVQKDRVTAAGLHATGA